MCFEQNDFLRFRVYFHPTERISRIGIAAKRNSVFQKGDRERVRNCKLGKKDVLGLFSDLKIFVSAERPSIVIIVQNE